MAALGKVLKAYECCKNPIIKGCEQCPYEKICYHDQFCLTAIKDALEVIREQKKQIQELKKRNNYLQSKTKDQRELIEAYKTGVRWEKRT